MGNCGILYVKVWWIFDSDKNFSDKYDYDTGYGCIE